MVAAFIALTRLADRDRLARSGEATRKVVLGQHLGVVADVSHGQRPSTRDARSSSG